MGDLNRKSKIEQNAPYILINNWGLGRISERVKEEREYSFPQRNQLELNKTLFKRPENY